MNKNNKKTTITKDKDSCGSIFLTQAALIIFWILTVVLCYFALGLYGCMRIFVREETAFDLKFWGKLKISNPIAWTKVQGLISFCGWL